MISARPRILIKLKFLKHFALEVKNLVVWLKIPTYLTIVTIDSYALTKQYNIGDRASYFAAYNVNHFEYLR